MKREQQKIDEPNKITIDGINGSINFIYGLFNGLSLGIATTLPSINSMLLLICLIIFKMVQPSKGTHHLISVLIVSVLTVEYPLPLWLWVVIR